MVAQTNLAIEKIMSGHRDAIELIDGFTGGAEGARPCQVGGESLIIIDQARQLGSAQTPQRAPAATQEHLCARVKARPLFELFRRVLHRVFRVQNKEDGCGALAAAMPAGVFLSCARSRICNSKRSQRSVRSALRARLSRSSPTKGSSGSAICQTN